MLKNSYLCSTEQEDGNGTQGSEIFVSGLQKFLPAQGAKIPSGNRQNELINHKLQIFDFLLQLWQ